jgi:hypothetical protein
LPDTDNVISVARKEGSTISTPGNRQTFRIRVLSLTQLSKFRTEFINNGFGFEIPDLDTVGSGSTEPVTVRRESESINGRVSFKRIEVLGFGKIPEHDNTVLTSRGTERTIGRDGNSVDITVVTNEVGTKLQFGKIPNLYNLIPTTRNNDGSSRVRRETNTRDPFGVTVFGDVVLAFTKSVPQLDGLVTRTGNNLTVVGRERNRENIIGVANETTSGISTVQIPKTQSMIPRSGQSELTIRRDGKVFNEVRVTNKRLAGYTIVYFISNFLFISCIIHTIFSHFHSTYLVRFQTMIVLSREADKTMSGASEVVAIAVTINLY